MKKTKGTGHPILDRVALIDKRYIEELDPDTVPTDPQAFLDWWWETDAKACKDCILCENRTQVVKPDGAAPADIMIVGEGPGFMEDLTGIPMVGPLELRGSRCGGCLNNSKCYSHKFLQSPTSWGKKAKIVDCQPNFTGKREISNTKFYIRSAGSIVDGILLDKWKFNYPRQNWIEWYNRNQPEPFPYRSPWFITNIVLCRATDVTRLKDAKPDSAAKTKCKRHLAMQWAAVQPKLIIAVGRVALGVLMRSESNADRIPPNSLIETKFGPVLFQNHPASFMREDNRETKGLGYAKVAQTLETALEYVGYPTD